MTRFLGLAILVAGGLASAVPQERIVSKEDTDLIFGLTKSQWATYARQIAHPEGWQVRLNPLDTGLGVMAYDPKTGFGLSIQPLYANDDEPPMMLTVGSYYPEGTFPEFTESLKQQMAQGARDDLGVHYEVAVTFRRMTLSDRTLEVVEITITRASD